MTISRRGFFSGLFGGGAIVATSVATPSGADRGVTCLHPQCPQCFCMFDCSVPYGDGFDADTIAARVASAIAPTAVQCSYCGWRGEIIRYRRL